MKRDLSAGQPVGLGGVKKSRNRDIKERTIFNMSEYDIIAFSQIRQKIHEFFLASRTDPSRLHDAFETLEQAWAIIEFACSDSLRKPISKRILEVRDALETAHFDPGKDVGKYATLRREIKDLIRALYRAKQLSGLGIPREKVRNQDTNLEEALL